MYLHNRFFCIVWGGDTDITERRLSTSCQRYCRISKGLCVTCIFVFEFSVELDVSIAHLWRPDIILNAAQSSGSVAPMREEKGGGTYSSEKHPCGSNPNVVLFV